MKKLLCLVLITLFLVGCASAKIVTRIDANIGEAWIEANDIGIPTAEGIVKAWPMVSGMIEGIYGSDFRMKLSPDVQAAMADMDVLCFKYFSLTPLVATDPLVKKDAGKILGLTARLEYLAGREFKDRYGVTIYNMIKSLAL